jgi:hypothetical protein
VVVLDEQGFKAFLTILIRRFLGYVNKTDLDFMVNAVTAGFYQSI